MFFWFALIFAFFLFVLLRAFWRDRQYVRKPTREVLRPEVLDELKAERAEFDREAAAFKQALHEAQTKKSTTQKRHEDL